RSRYDSSATAQQAGALTESLDDRRSKLTVAVRKVWLDLHESQSRLQVTEQAVAQADENLHVARSLFKRGMAKHTQVLDAEQLRTRTLNNHTQARYDHLMSAIRLRYELGEL
ncbi:MAG: TolC family protein, partial [Thiogranum sp.]